MGAIRPDDEKFIFGYVKPRQSSSDAISLTLFRHGSAGIEEWKNLSLSWEGSSSLEFDGDIAFSSNGTLYAVLSENTGGGTAVFRLEDAQLASTTTVGHQPLSTSMSIAERANGLSFLDTEGNALSFSGTNQRRFASIDLLDLTDFSEGEPAEVTSIERTDLGSCAELCRFELTLQLDRSYRPNDVHTVGVRKKDIPDFREKILPSVVSYNEISTTHQFAELPIVSGQTYELTHYVNGELDKGQRYLTVWECDDFGEIQEIGVGDTARITERQYDRSQKNCTARVIPGGGGVAFETWSGWQRAGGSQWELVRVGSDAPAITVEDCDGKCSGPDLHPWKGRIYVRLPEPGEYILRETRGVDWGAAITSERRFTLTEDEPRADLGHFDHEPFAVSLSVALKSFAGLYDNDSGQGYVGKEVSIQSSSPRSARLAVQGRPRNTPQVVNQTGRVDQPWKIDVEDRNSFRDVKLTVPLLEGYSPGQLICILRDGDGQDLEAHVVRASDMQIGSKGIDVPLPLISNRGDVECTHFYVKNAGAVQWEVVDAATDDGHLGGSSWSLAIIGRPDVIVRDCGDKDCQGGFDVDPRPGYVRVIGLENGEYTVRQVSAPGGYEMGFDATRDFEVDALNQNVDLGRFEYSSEADQVDQFSCYYDLYSLDAKGGIRAVTPLPGQERPGPVAPLPPIAPGSTMDALGIHIEGTYAMAVENLAVTDSDPNGYSRLWKYIPDARAWVLQRDQDGAELKLPRVRGAQYTAGTISTGLDEYFVGYVKPRTAADQPIELVLMNPTGRSVKHWTVVRLAWPESSSLEFDADIEFGEGGAMYIVASEKSGNSTAVFVVQESKIVVGGVSPSLRLSVGSHAAGTVSGLAFADHSPIVSFGGPGSQRFAAVDLLDLSEYGDQPEHSPVVTVRRTDLSSCNFVYGAQLTLLTDPRLTNSDVHSLGIVPHGSQAQAVSLPVRYTRESGTEVNTMFLNVPFVEGRVYDLVHYVNGGSEDQKRYFTSWECEGYPHKVSAGAGQRVRVDQSDLGGGRLRCTARTQPGSGVSLEAQLDGAPAPGSQWELSRVGSFEPARIITDCEQNCREGDLHPKPGSIQVHIPDPGAYVLRQTKAVDWGAPVTQEYRFTISNEHPHHNVGGGQP